jgi:hypothetical protein
VNAGPPLERLVGTWDFEATVEGRPMERGWATLDWMGDGTFVVQRADADRSTGAPAGWIGNSPMPVSSVIGYDDTTRELSMLYSDARGVRRIYRMTLSDTAWTLSRDAPGFFQRFVGRLSDDGSTIDGRWESSPDGSEWAPDFDIRYRKRS